MATRLQNPFLKKISSKKEPPPDMHPHVPQRDEEPEEYIEEYGTIEEAPRPNSVTKKRHVNESED